MRGFIISCLWFSCEATIHAENNAFVTESFDKVTDGIGHDSDNNNSTDSDATALVNNYRQNPDETYHPVKRKVKNNSKNRGFDLPLMHSHSIILSSTPVLLSLNAASGTSSSSHSLTNHHHQQLMCL